MLGNKIHFISLGCPRNLVDTEVMLGLLLKNGYEVTEELSSADYIVINTCGFLKEAREESLDVIGASLDDRKAGAKVIATGCMVQTHSSDIKKAHPHVDYFLGSGDAEEILKAVRSSEPGENVSDAKSYLEVGEVPRTVSTPKHYAYLKIAEGCRKRCSYCIIPSIKGPLKSKSIERVLKEFRLLLKGGAKEIILIAQDLGDFGRDSGFRGVDGLVHLLEELKKEEGDFWIRLLYLYPDEITDELISVIRSDPRICPYLDMPIQHINDDILKAMRRKTSGKQILEIIAKLRREMPDIVIRTSLIVGFPGESEEQFEQLCAFVKKAELDNVGIFTFSKEEGSHAATLPGQIAARVKERRKKVLMKIQQKIVEKKSHKRVGTKVKALIEGYHPDSDLLMTARFSGQCPEIDGTIIINDPSHVTHFGDFYTLKVTDSLGYDMVGAVCPEV